MEYLKTIRTHHYLLLLTSFTTFALSLMPQRVGDYRRAYEELAHLETLNDFPLAIYVALAINRVSGIEESGQEGRVNVRVEPSSSVTAGSRFFFGAMGEGDLFTRLLRAAYDTEELSFKTATLAQIEHAFGMVFPVPMPTEQQVGALKACGDGKTTIWLTVKQQGEHHDLALPGELPDISLSTLASVVGATCTEVATDYVTFRELAGEQLRPFDDDTVLTGFAEDLRFSRMEAPESLLDLPRISIWRIVEDMTVSEAKRELVKRLESSEGSQTVLGLSLHRQLAVTVLPLLVVIIQLLMASHALVALSRVSKDDIKNCAWIGFYPDPFFQLITALSLTIVPAYSIYALAEALGVDEGRLLGLAGVVATGLATWWATFQLSRRMFRVTETPTGGRFRSGRGLPRR